MYLLFPMMSTYLSVRTQRKTKLLNGVFLMVIYAFFYIPPAKKTKILNFIYIGHKTSQLRMIHLFFFLCNIVFLKSFYPEAINASIRHLAHLSSIFKFSFISLIVISLIKQLYYYMYIDQNS